MLDRDALRIRLIDHGLARVADELAELATPSVTILATIASDDDIPVGSSKFGGCPDAPTDFTWPHWKDKPLAFLAQISLSTCRLWS